MREQASQSPQRPAPNRARRRATRRGATTAAAVTAGILTMTALTPPPASAAPRPAPVQQSLNALVQSNGFPAALAAVQDREGHTRNYTAGVADLTTKAKVPTDGQVRIGSNTKTFTAVVVLQLVGEGKVSLDAMVDTYLPGLVRGEGIDGSHITVRELLQQTSGLPSYTNDDDLEPRYYEPRDLLDRALKHKADFAPGEKWGYSNTNYVVAGLIVQKVTGRPLAAEIDQRIIKKIGLRHTYFPAPGDPTIREPHPKGYSQDAPGGPLSDITEMDPSWAWAAGQLISTNSDLNRFFSALLGGRLLAAPQLKEMQKTVPATAPFGPNTRYGLGLLSTPLSCGGVYWGHGGSFPGYETRGGATNTGRAANVAVTLQPTDPAAMKPVDALVDKALCSAG
ncbi:serine hydrolase domain-containing protein [Streptomyces sp. WM6378]|uniref:serine hydrolase domain-containing protein n=1 Tax=Streptomyces sp. WM6378 TaxID=1415557 RepID=UPI000AE76A33